MEIPLGVKIIVLVLSAVAVFTLAAWELVLQWLGSLAGSLFKSILALPRQVAKGFARNGIPVFKPKARQPV
jgi:hypothetical protein